MKRAILLLVGVVCCGQLGCDTQTTAKLILTVGLRARVKANAGEDFVATAARPERRAPGTPDVDALVAAMRELAAISAGAETGQATAIGNAANRATANREASTGSELAARVSEVIDRLAGHVASLEQRASVAPALVQQAREAQAVALARAAELLPSQFAGRLDAYCQATFGQAWDREAVEKQAVNRLVSGYLVAPRMPADVPQVLALHSVTFPRNAMNVELHATIAERLAGEGDLRGGIALAKAGLRACADQPDVALLRDRLKRIYRDHAGEIGVPMNFAGPTMNERRFALSDLRGHPVLVVFWSTTDPASDEFVVNCNQLAKQFPSTGIEVVGVSLNAKMEDLELWFFTHGIQCRHVFSAEHAGFDNPIARFYHVTAVPEFFLLDDEGVVIARGDEGLDQVENELRRLAGPRLASS